MASRGVIAACNDILKAMQGQAWQDGLHDGHYGELWMRLEDRLAKQTAQYAADNCQRRPSRAELWEIAAEIASPLPTEEDGWAELLLIRERRGIYARRVGTFPSGQPMYDTGAPDDWSHPLLLRVVEDLGGWNAVVNADKDGVMRAHFRSAWETRSRQWREAVRGYLYLKPEERPELLFPEQRRRLPALEWRRPTKQKALPPAPAPKGADEAVKREVMGRLRKLLPKTFGDSPQTASETPDNAETGKPILIPIGGENDDV